MSEKPKKHIYEQPELCDHILSRVDRSSVPLRINASSIPHARNGLFVVNDVKAGHEIFRSQPLLVVSEGNNNDVCDHCFLNKNSSVHPDGHFFQGDEGRESIKILSCTGCRVVEYCSKECQRTAWKSYHKLECPVLRQIKEFNKNMGALPRALCRLILWIENKAMSRSNYKAIVNLETHYKEHNDDWYEKNDEGIPPTFMVASNVRQATTPDDRSHVEPGLYLDTRRCQELYCMLMANAGAICPPEGEIQYGSFLDLVVSMINHSCDANAHVFFEGRELRCRALRDIPAGSEITVNYYPTPRLDVLLRRSTLKQYMFITCNCHKCKDEMAEHVAAAVDRQDHLAKFKQGQLDLLKLGEDAERAFSRSHTVKSCISFQDQIGNIIEKSFPGGHWPHHIEPLPSIYRTLGSMYRDMHYVVGLEFVLKGTIYVRDHSGPGWTNDVVNLVKFMFFVAQAADNEMKWVGAVKNSELLERSTMRDVARAYLSIACLDGKHTFGMESKFVRALYKWAGDSIDYPGDLGIHTEGFRERFKDSQERLLTWAGMKAECGLRLPSNEQIAELRQDIAEI
ncbi:SET domain-containing protein [Cryphonectria parasitica EP155]|uniref:SET domain-containing protein n=1 Tax=Cryphonectria parasitica (strain ATCC 38755 / EP155) TaxID=660469 RepID=A0A9P5CR32_CRYP1|nr:SET domain-containing protein [Cryphonectria parasitica EP155]KAF3767117.1 SET domain-containing protein [Cryphonectria parasitica EP155]